MPAIPLISIITVTYNAGEVIGKTMQSLKEQSWQDFEHLVIDGASSDNTIETVKSFNLPQTLVFSEPDKGLYDAMNKGLQKAKGSYVIFLNAGDSFHSPVILQEYAREALKGAQIIYGDTDIVDTNAQKISPRHLQVPSRLSKKSFSQGMLICHQAFMVKKEIAPAYDLAYRFSADYDWCVRCIMGASPEKCVNLHQTTINYLADGLTDKNKWKSLRERFRIMSRHYGFPLTLFNHFGFILRSIKRGKI